MHVRPVHRRELDLFIEAGGSPRHDRQTLDYLESMFSAGSMRPEWCFVAEDEGRLLGRVAFWTLPGMEHPFALVLLDVARDGDFEAVGRGLLRDVLGRARDLGSRQIEHVVDDPPSSPQFQYRPEVRMPVLEATGFTLRRRTNRMEWAGGAAPQSTGRLYFRTLDEVGEEAFVTAMMEVSEGTLDGEILADRERLGPYDAAREFFEDASTVEHDATWWRLAYEESSGRLVGLVMPAKPPAFLTVFYIGVVPDMRGRGYVDDLLSEATATLLEAGSADGIPLKADTDIANSPMISAFERGGWRRFATRREYGLTLSDRTP